ncbi:MAG: hypothetical protein EKK57_11105 [Proteobacteria bacterium]|nr:MAG: hypothetical protein EKK57_11105 [Pseudomonadota bacterium]
MKANISLNQRQSEFLRDLLHTIHPEHIIDFLVDNDILDDEDTKNLLKQLEIMDPEYYFGVKNAG